MSAPIVIIGTGLAGYNLAKELRKGNQDTPIVMITSDDGRNYSKPMLSTGFGKGKDADGLAMADAGKMAEQLRLEIRTHQSVTAIDTNNKRLTLGSDEIQYDKLVLALGAEPIRLPLPGFEHLYHINDLMDYDQFHGASQGKKDVLVMGAGLVGCEYAHDMAVAGFNVTLVAPDKTPLSRLLPEPCGEALEQALLKLGVTVRLNTGVTAIAKTDEGIVASLNNGESITADIGLSAVGLKPRTDLAAQAGLLIGQGIQVNRQLQTSADDVYAIGDCMEVDGLNLLYVLPLMNCARTLAKTLNGEPTEINYPVMPVQVKTPSLPITVCPPAQNAEGQWQIDGESPNFKGVFVGNDGKLLGYALTGECVAEKMALNKEMPAMLA